MLAQVRGRDNHLGLADIVVLEEDDLEQVANLVVVVDDGGLLREAAAEPAEAFGQSCDGIFLEVVDGGWGAHVVVVVARGGS